MVKISKYLKQEEKSSQSGQNNTLERDNLETKGKVARELGNLLETKETPSSLPAPELETGKREKNPHDFEDDIRDDISEQRFRKAIGATKNKRLAKLIELDKKLASTYNATDHDVSLTTTLSLDEERHEFISGAANFLGINIKEMTFLVIDVFRAKYQDRILELNLQELQRKMKKL